MAISLSTVKCPQCNADLSVEGNKEFFFCQYCGTKVMVNNENEYIYRTIDEAGIKQAETDRFIRLRQLEMQERAEHSRKKLIVMWLIATALLTLMGIIGMTIDNEGMGMCLFLAMLVGMWGSGALLENKKKRRLHVAAGPNEVAITGVMQGYRERNYNSVLSLYRIAGFTNVNAVALRDLTIFNLRRNGQVEEVTINGVSEFEEGDIFPKSANVLITYHSR
ncbi:MAG: TFIIB-type zinc finger domain-containing protein [Lachnospiraceae bacterium]|nr:TFIIB-type zinc finger domain-containing protein [Lachnospiraceae bacterium]